LINSRLLAALRLSTASAPHLQSPAYRKCIHQSSPDARCAALLALCGSCGHASSWTAARQCRRKVGGGGNRVWGQNPKLHPTPLQESRRVDCPSWCSAASVAVQPRDRLHHHLFILTASRSGSSPSLVQLRLTNSKRSLLDLSFRSLLNKHARILCRRFLLKQLLPSLTS